MFNDLLLDHFRSPRNVGELSGADVRTVRVSNPACGDELSLDARIKDGRIVEVRYRVRGCTASIAAGSVLTELLENCTLAKASALTGAAIESAAGGLSSETRHAAVLGADAVRALLAFKHL